MQSFIDNLPRLPKRQENAKSQNPINLIRSLSWLQAAFFASAWLAWTCDAIDFFATSLAVSKLVKAFGKDTHTITTSITLTLLFRPLGAVIFGLASDRYGRKWPLILNLLICAALSLGSGFAKDFQAFLAIRCLFGIAMGGIWGQSASLGLENMPVEARGLFSGVLQQGYAVGYLISSVINLEAVPHHGWPILFFIGAGISAFAALVRLALPESTYFVERSRAAALQGGEVISSGKKSKIFLVQTGKALKLHWIRCIWAVLLMAGFNFLSHGSQDLYPTILESKGLTNHQATLGNIVGNCGAILGGLLAGWISQTLGRRLTIIACCIWTCAFLPLWYLPKSFGGLAAGAFCVQMGVQGAWGVIPIYLSEISPVAFRAVWPGVAYQLGNMISSASAQIEATAGGNIKQADGKPNYALVSVILVAVVAIWIILCVTVGREDHAAHFERGKAAFEKGGGLDELDDGHDRFPEMRAADEEKGSVTHSEEKGSAQQREYA